MTVVADLKSLSIELNQNRVRWLIQDAVQTLQRMPGGREKHLGPLRSHMPNALRSYWDSFGVEGYDRPKVVRLQPIAPQIERMDEVLGWIYLIDQPHIRKAVFLRGIPLGWRRIGKLLECSRETARRWEIEGVNRILERLVSA